MQNALITVILPSLNVKRYIEECMESVIGQSFSNLEILCIDAGSTDGTLEVLEKYALADQRIKIIHSSVKSYGKQINMGIDLAKGKYIAVVETDDYINQYMYEKLHDIAEENQLDFVKADFRGFRILHNGQPVYDEGRVWRSDELYGKLIAIKEFPELYIRDVNIWKGIYNKNFLINNNIRLNETAGAAFQDIGFCMLLLLYAKRGMYVKDMLYYYRRDNGNSSSNKPHGLQFAYQEFKRLLNIPVLGEDKELFYHYLYIRMAYVFIGEYEKLLYHEGISAIAFCKIISWFQQVLGEAIDKKVIVRADLGDYIWEKLHLLIDDEEAYAKKWNNDRNRQNNDKRNMLNKIRVDRVVIFGCGYYGSEALLFCDQNEIDIAAFSDNNSALWGSKHYGYEVCEPFELQTKYCDAKILISLQKYGEDIKKQLVDMGICKERILKYKAKNWDLGEETNERRGC